MENKMSIDNNKLDKAIKDIRWNSDGLVPAIVQDIDSKEILMLAYMNEEALRKTITEGKAVYYSRSRQSLWLKGETSGHYQEVKDILFDCDKDTILLKVKQIGMACHEDFYSCFHYQLADGEKSSNGESDNPGATEDSGTTENSGKAQEGIQPWRTVGEPNIRPSLSLGRTLELLAETIKIRNKERPEGAYTTYLFTKGIDKILKKVGEECAEVIIGAKNNSSAEIRYETADLFYHLLVMLEDRGVCLDEVAEELASRRK